MANTMMKGKQDRVEEAEQEGRDWSDLPGELLPLIGQRLIKLKLAIRFRAVCKRWRRTLAELQPIMSRRSWSSPPLLMLPYCNDDAACGSGSQQQLEGCQCRLFLDLAHNQYHHIDFVEGFEGSSCRGSAFGWLFMLQLPAPVLLNPLTGKQIQLPPITSLSDVLQYDPELVGREYLVQHPPDGDKLRVGKRRLAFNYMRRFAMSSPDPTSEGCIVMAILQNCYMDLVFCKPGMNKWVLVPNPGGYYFQNIVFWRNQFYAINCKGKVLCCDLSNPAVPTMSCFVDNVDMLTHAAYLLVGPADELMMVTKSVEYEDRDVDEHGPPVHHDHDEEVEDQDVDDHGLPVPHHHDEVDDQASVPCFSDMDTDDEMEMNTMDNYWSTDFQVYKLNEGTCRWDAVQSIGDFALFVGSNTPTYLATKDYPEVKSNCIYFTDDEFSVHVRGRFGGHDMGIYHLDDGTTESFCCTKFYKPGLVWPQPVWIVPSNC